MQNSFFANEQIIYRATVERLERETLLIVLVLIAYVLAWVIRGRKISRSPRLNWVNENPVAMICFTLFALFSLYTLIDFTYVLNTPAMTVKGEFVRWHVTSARSSIRDRYFILRDADNAQFTFDGPVTDMFERRCYEVTYTPYLLRKFISSEGFVHQVKDLGGSCAK